jgi:histone-lysine N-methyltransferase MLL3
LCVSVQQQRVQMRMVSAAVREGPARVVSVVPGGPVIQHSGVGVSRMGLAPPPPPPPYPGPPPPYPGPCQQVSAVCFSSHV